MEDEVFRGAIIFHMPGDLAASPYLRGTWRRPILDLLIEAGAPFYSNDVHMACATFAGWCLSQDPRPVDFLSIHSLPGLPWDESEIDPFEWHDRLMDEIKRWDEPVYLVDFDHLIISCAGKVLWPKGRQFPIRRRPKDGSPFVAGWFMPRLGESQYSFHDLADLPPLREPLKGDFGWLERSTTVDYPLTQAGDTEDAALMLVAHHQKNVASLDQLLSSHVPLPKDFVRFFRSPTLWRKLRSCESCYFDLDTVSKPIRGGLGSLLYFMTDGQNTKNWCLMASPEGHFSVVATYRYPTMEDPEPYPGDVTVCASSFEEFLYRFWMENEIWFALYQQSPMPPGGEEYLAHLNLKRPNR